MVRTERAGTIVITASLTGTQGRVPYLSDYVASKFGVVGLTQAMALECAGRGSTAEAVKQFWIADTSLVRLEQPEDLARSVEFLLSEDASFITNEALATKGGHPSRRARHLLHQRTRAGR